MSSSVGGGGGGGGAGAGGDIASLLEKAKELDQVRKEQDEVVTEINKIHKKILSQYPKDWSDSSRARSDVSHGRAAYTGSINGYDSGHETGGGNFEFNREERAAVAQQQPHPAVGPFFRQVPYQRSGASTCSSCVSRHHGAQLQEKSSVLLSQTAGPTRHRGNAPEMVDKSVDTILPRLRTLYAHAKELSESEVSASSALVGLLDGLLQSGVSAAQRKKIEVGEQKKKRMKSDTDSARFSSASMRSQLDQAANLKGEQVAARVKSDDEKDEWFVVKVIHFDKETKEFEVLDEEPGDDEESAQKYERKYKLPMSYIIPFPKKGDPSSAPDFGQGRQVLAVYPGTTALYRATVASHRKRKSDDYILLFDDDEEDGSLPQRAVPFYRVVALPEGHRQ